MKNKKQLTLPTTQTFTLKEVFTLNPAEKEITARVKFTKIKETGRIAELGCRSGGMGRPTKVFAFTPITKIMIAKAKSEKINLADGVETSIIG
jgi:hypothetical protein